MSFRTPKSVWAALVLGACACNSRPVAPPLDPSAGTYHNAEEGFRFDAPSDWARMGIAPTPARPPAGEWLWVKYRNLSIHRPTFFRASFIDLPESKTVAAYLAERPPGPETWHLSGVADKMTLDGVPAVRYRFNGNWGPDAMVKEVVAVQRGRRTIFFTGIYPLGDVKSRDAIQAAYKTIRWDRSG